MEVVPIESATALAKGPALNQYKHPEGSNCMKRRFSVVLVIAIFAVAATAAVAANVHFKKSPPLTFADGGLTLSASGALTGLGNGDLVITLSATGQPIATCTNPSGANQPAPHNPAAAEFGGVQEIPAGSVKNGNVSFSVGTTAPATPIAGSPECPNKNWTEDIIDVQFSGFSSTITVYQGIGCSVANFGACTLVFQSTQTIP
jgi:hypothetical protein